MVARYGKGARILNELTSLSSRAVLMLCDSCPTCKAADRERLAIARRACRSHGVPLTVIMPGSSYYSALLVMHWQDRPDQPLPEFWHNGQWHSTATDFWPDDDEYSSTPEERRK